MEGNKTSSKPDHFEAVSPLLKCCCFNEINLMNELIGEGVAAANHKVCFNVDHTVKTLPAIAVNEC